MEFEPNFDQNLKQLIQMLKRILSSHFSKDKFQGHWIPFKDPKDYSLNFFVFNFFAPPPEDLEEEDEFTEEDTDVKIKDSSDFSCHLTADDLEFLRRHGIRF